jgi:hypothetical protein
MTEYVSPLEDGAYHSVFDELALSSSISCLQLLRAIGVEGKKLGVFGVKLQLQPIDVDPKVFALMLQVHEQRFTTPIAFVGQSDHLPLHFQLPAQLLNLIF